MKAILCAEPYSLGIVERPAPSRGEGEVLVRVRRVGLCGTDYHIFQGRHPYLIYPRVMGHELAGEIEAVPDGSAFRPGQIVAINPYFACGLCIACRKNKANACANVRVLGVHMDGGMCELLAVPEPAVIDAAGLSLDEAAMIEFLAIGTHAVERAGLSPGDRVLVVGAGPIGVGVALFARLAGARVTLVDSRPIRLSHARERLGFKDSVEAGPALASLLADRTDGEMFDAVFDATGSIAAMAQSLAYVSHGGTLVLVGVALGNLVLADPEFHKRETSLLASRNALSSDFERVIEAMRAGLIPTDALLTHRLAVEDIPARMAALIADADHVLKVIASFPAIS